MREGAAVAGGENIGVAGAQPVVGPDTVLDGKARIPRQSDFRDGADAGNDPVADDARSIGQHDGMFGAVALDPLDTGPKPQIHSGGLMPLGDQFGDRGGHAPHQQARRHLDQGDGAFALDGAGRDLQPDEAAADHHQPGTRPKPGAHQQRVGELPQVKHVLRRGSRQCQLAGRGPCRQQQFPVGNFPAIAQSDAVPVAVDADDGASAQMGDVGVPQPRFIKDEGGAVGSASATMTAFDRGGRS